MRMNTSATLAAAAVLAVATASPASAATDVHVSIGPKLQAAAATTYGVREVDQLAEALRQNVQRQLDRTGAYDGARLDLVLADATPNRPTFKELSDRPGLSMRSISLGGARIEGRAIRRDGAVSPVAYSYYASDLRDERGQSTWGDAQWAFQQFAYRLSHGPAVASR